VVKYRHDGFREHVVTAALEERLDARSQSTVPSVRAFQQAMLDALAAGLGGVAAHG
jgi:hypothetical protein